MHNGGMASGWRSLVERVRSLFSSRRWRIARNGLVAGLAAGSVSVAYRAAIARGTGLAHAADEAIAHHPLWLLVWLVAALAVATVAWRLVAWEPTASGSGIPQVAGRLTGRVPLRPVRVLAARFVGGTGASLFGLSLGREGPSIHLGAAVGQLLARPLGASEEETDHLITSGAAAGLSAAFNAPVSGMLFAMEGLHRSFSPLIIASAATGALATDVASTLVFGSRPLLQFSAPGGGSSEIPLSLLWVVLPLGVLTGLVGALVNRSLLACQSMTRLPGPLPVLIAMLAALACGLLAPRVLGGGEELIRWAQIGSVGLGSVLALLLLKFVLTGVSFGSGIPGGIFMPILAIGTLTGVGYALVAHDLGLSADLRVALAVCGMAGVLAASVRTPLTSILLTAEMTGSLGHLLPVATVVLLAIFTADALRVPPIYQALLERSLGPDVAALVPGASSPAGGDRP